MTIKTQLNDSMKDAMKSGDEVRKRTVRMALAAVKQAEVDKRIELDDTAVINLLQKEVKNRRESLEEAKKRLGIERRSNTRLQPPSRARE